MGLIKESCDVNSEGRMLQKDPTYKEKVVERRGEMNFLKVNDID